MSLSDSDERVITEGKIASCREQMSFTSSSTRMHRDKHDKFHTSYDIKRDVKK